MREVSGSPELPVFTDGLWLSLVERFVRDEEAAGSNPASPSEFAPQTRVTR